MSGLLLRCYLALLLLAVPAGAVLGQAAARPRASELFRAAKFNNTYKLKSLLKQGVWVNVRDADGNTPLMLSARGLWRSAYDGCRRADCKKRLERSARNNARVLEILLKAGADVNTKNKQGNTALHTAAAACMPRTATALLDAKANINASNRRGYAPLMSVVEAAGKLFDDYSEDSKDHRNRCDRTVKLLLARKPDLSLKNKQGEDVHAMARRTRNAHVMRLLPPGPMAAAPPTCEVKLASNSRRGASPRVYIILKNNAVKSSLILTKISERRLNGEFQLERNGRPLKLSADAGDRLPRIAGPLKSGRQLHVILSLASFFDVSRQGQYRFTAGFKSRMFSPDSPDELTRHNITCNALRFTLPLNSVRDRNWLEHLKKDARVRALNGRMNAFIADLRRRGALHASARIRLSATTLKSDIPGLQLELENMDANQAEAFVLACLNDTRCRFEKKIRFRIPRSTFADPDRRSAFERRIALASNAGIRQQFVDIANGPLFFRVERPGELSTVQRVRRKRLLEGLYAFMKRYNAHMELNDLSFEKGQPAVDVRLSLSTYADFRRLMTGLQAQPGDFHFKIASVSTNGALVLRGDIKVGRRTKPDPNAPDLQNDFTREILESLLKKGAPTTRNIGFGPSNRVSLSFVKLSGDQLRRYLDPWLLPKSRARLTMLSIRRDPFDETKHTAIVGFQGVTGKGYFRKRAAWKTLHPIMFPPGQVVGVPARFEGLSYYAVRYIGTNLSLRFVVAKRNLEALKKALTARAELVRPKFSHEPSSDGKTVVLEMKGFLKIPFEK